MPADKFFVENPAALRPNTGLGGDNNLEVIVSSYKPNVKCKKGPAPPWRSAVSVFADMVTTTAIETFDKAGMPDVDVPLPFYVRQGGS